MSTKWSSFQDIAHDKCAITHQLHVDYGPVVRIGPNELSFSDPAVAKKLYSQSAQFAKAPVYDTLGNGHHPTLFDMRNRALHRERRKALEPAFAKATVDRAEAGMAEQLVKFFGWVGRKEDVPLNMFMRCRMIALDVTGAMFLGRSFGAQAPLTATPTTRTPSASTASWRSAACAGSSPGPCRCSLLKRVPIARLRQFLGVSDRMYDFGRHAYADYVKMFGQSQHGHYKPDDPVARLLACNSKGNATLSPDEIGAEVGSLLIAGTDPVGTTLAFAAWELGRNPEWQDILRRPSGAEGQRRPLRSRCSPAMARYWESR